jgi:hypothetical protein
MSITYSTRCDWVYALDLRMVKPGSAECLQDDLASLAVSARSAYRQSTTASPGTSPPGICFNP